MDASTDLRKTENIFYPPALRIAVHPSSQASIAPKAPKIARPVDVGTTKATSEPAKEPAKERKADKEKEASKEKEVAKDKVTEHFKPPPAAKANSPTTY